jgi:hypothetical protein
MGFAAFTSGICPPAPDAPDIRQSRYFQTALQQ